MYSNKETSIGHVNQERREGRPVWHNWQKWKISTEFWSVIVRVKNLLLPYQSHLCRIFGEQSGNGTGFSSSTSVFPVVLIPLMLNVHSSAIREQDNGHISGRTRTAYIHRHAPPQYAETIQTDCLSLDNPCHKMFSWTSVFSNQHGI